MGQSQANGLAEGTVREIKIPFPIILLGRNVGWRNPERPSRCCLVGPIQLPIAYMSVDVMPTAKQHAS